MGKQKENQRKDTAVRVRISRSKRTRNLPIRYSSLRHIQDGIRLFQLLPGNSGDEIQCLLYTTRLSENPEYEALSYVWGDASITEPITCSNRRLNITVNLADALRHLRSKTETRILFADAICINQQDTKERGHQVRLMADIFHSAKHVIIWLGPDTDGTAELACGYIHRYSSYLIEHYPKYGSCEEFMVWANLAPNSTAFAALARMLNLPWFSRVWTIQEAALAKSSTIAYGSAEVDIEELIRYVEGVYQWSTFEICKLLDPCNVFNLFRNIWCTFAAKGTWWGHTSPEDILHQPTGSRTSLLNLSTTISWRDVTDHRDLIYAMLGHPTLQAKNTTTPLVQPDYGITFQELFHKLTIACIETNSDFSVLGLVQHDNQEMSRTLPTWIPDLKQRMRPFEVSGITTFTAGSLLIPQTSFLDLRFCCRGIPVDIVQSVVQQFPQAVDQSFGSDFEDWIMENNSMVKAIADLMQIEFKPLTLVDGGSLSKIECLAYLLSGCEAGTHISSYDDIPVTMKAWTDIVAQFVQFAAGLPVNIDNGSRRMRQDARNTLMELTSFARVLVLDMFYVCSERRVVLTKGGYLGLGPPTTKEGDVCCIINGAKVPFILHPRGDQEGSYEFVGECCLPGFMFGEVVEMLERGEVQEQMFTIY